MKRISQDEEEDLSQTNKRARLQDPVLFERILELLCGKQRVGLFTKYLPREDLLRLSMCSRGTLAITHPSVDDLAYFRASAAPWRFYSPRCITFNAKTTSMDCIPPDCRKLKFWSPRVLPMLPESIEKLVLMGELEDYKIDRMPSRLIGLTIQQFSDLPKGLLPRGLKRLTLGPGSGGIPLKISPPSKIEGLNQGLQELSFDHGTVFCSPVVGLPTTLTYLFLPDPFNQRIDSLPCCLKHLCLGDHFNQPIDHLPESLENLAIGAEDSAAEFNHPIDLLPDGLKRLQLMVREFDRPVQRLPRGLKVLLLGKGFRSIVDGLLPEGLEILDVGKYYWGNLSVLPPSLRFLRLRPKWLAEESRLVFFQRLILQGWRVKTEGPFPLEIWGSEITLEKVSRV